MIHKLKLSVKGFIVSSIILFTIPLALPQSQQIVLHPDPAYNYPVSQTDLKAAQQVLNRRLLGLNVPGWPRTRLKDSTIVLTVSNSVDAAEVVRDLTHPPELALIETGVEFPPVDGVTPVEIGPTANPDLAIYQRLLSQQDFLQAQPAPTDDGTVALEVALSPEGAARFADFINNRRGVYLCLTQDKVIIGCPIVKLVSDDRVQIQPGPVDFLINEQSLLYQINSSVLPIPLVAAK